LTVDALQARLQRGDEEYLVLDVRGDDEWASGHIPGAIHHFAGAIVQGTAPPLPVAGCVAVICGSGYRSSVAAGILQGRGHTRLVNVVGGMEAWLAAALPTTRG